MKHFIITTYFLSFIISTTWTQEKPEQTNEIGVYGGIGFNRITIGGTAISNYDFHAPKNTVTSFGLFYAHTFRSFAKLRVGLAGTYMLGDDFIETSKHTSFHLEVPVQFQYILNPENKVQVYLGLGLSVNRWFYTTTKSNDIPGNTKRNTKAGLDAIPVVLLGMNARVGEHVSIFLQPEYRPISISVKNNVRLKNFMAHVGVAYTL